MSVIDKGFVLEKLQERCPLIEQFKEDHEKYLMHVHGIGVTNFLTQVEGLENDIQISLRQRLAKSNKDIFADILNPTNKIFNSQGGSKVYHFKNSNKKESILSDYLSTLDYGSGLSAWLETYFVDKLVVDPNGIYLVEHKDQKPYPTYKSIYTIAAYEQKGRYLEFIIFEPECIKEAQKEEEKEYYVRVYDDAFDYTYLLKNDNLTLIKELTFKNPWGKVPAITCSDITDTLNNQKKSTIYEQIELADELLRKGSVKTLTEYHHGFPLFWMYMSTCPVCSGLGTVNREGQDGKTKSHTCHLCTGTGYALKKDVSDIKLIKPPENSDEPTITPDIAGYIVPPIDSLQYMDESLKIYRDMIYFSHWGTVINREDTEKTAFEVALNTQPMQDKLNKYTNSLEDTERKLTDLIGIYLYQDYEGSSINYGRNYIIKSPNQYLTEYLDEKAKNASYSILNGKLKMYYNALYAHDEYKRSLMLKLMDIEPWVHNTITEVKAWDLTPEEFARKLYYNDWLITKTKEEISDKDLKYLQNDLLTFAKTKSNEYTKAIQ